MVKSWLSRIQPDFPIAIYYSIDNNKISVTKPDINAVVMFDQPRTVSLLQKRENCKTKCIIPKRSKRDVIVKKANYKILKDALSKSCISGQDAINEADSYFGDHNYSLPPWKDSNLLFLWGSNQDDSVKFVESYEENKETSTANNNDNKVNNNYNDNNFENMHNKDSTLLDERLNYLENSNDDKNNSNNINKQQDSSEIAGKLSGNSKGKLRELICHTSDAHKSREYNEKDTNSVSDKKSSKVTREEYIKSYNTAEQFTKELSKEIFVRKIPKKIKRETSLDSTTEPSEHVDKYNSDSSHTTNGSLRDTFRNIKLKNNKKRKSSTDLYNPRRKPIKKRRESFHRFKSFEDKRIETSRIRRISKSEEKTCDNRVLHTHVRKNNKREREHVSKEEFLAKIMARWKKESVKSNTPVDMEISSDKEEDREEEREITTQESEETNNDEPTGEITTHVDGTPIVDGLSGCLKSVKPKLVVFKDSEPSKKKTKKKSLTWEQYRAKKQESHNQTEKNDVNCNKKLGGLDPNVDKIKDQATSLDSDLEPGEIICDNIGSTNEDANMEEVEKVENINENKSKILSKEQAKIFTKDINPGLTIFPDSHNNAENGVQHLNNLLKDDEKSEKKVSQQSRNILNSVRKWTGKNQPLLVAKQNSSSVEMHNKMSAYLSDYTDSSKYNDSSDDDNDEDLHDAYSFSRSCSSESESSYSSSDSSSEDEQAREKRYRRRRKSSYSFSSGSSRSWSRSRSRSPGIDRWQLSIQEERRRKKQDQIVSLQYRLKMFFLDNSYYLHQEQRRIVYVGRLPDNVTKRELRAKFEQFGKIECCSLHMRECG